MQQIEWAAQNNLRELNWSRLDLEELPPEISKCTQLEKLYHIPSIVSWSIDGT
jgi:Leucine-rich repeat (LRR) protein